ncbi:TPA: FRG domain-containing protein [Vibrio diabolicus]
MEITSYKIDSLELLHRVFSSFRSQNGHGYWFRGHADLQWDLTPSAGRVGYRLPDNRDLGRCHEWCQDAHSLTTFPESFIERLAIAQHHGLATRLLDWTKNPLVACFFAVSALPEKDAAIYALESLSLHTRATIQITRENLESFSGVMGYHPKAINSRLVSQQGLFTVHCPAHEPLPITQSLFELNETNVKRFVIPSDKKASIRQMLDNYGVNEATLFPDLDGLARYVNRHTEEMHTRNF